MERYHTCPAGTRFWGEKLYLQTEQSTGDWKMAVGIRLHALGWVRNRTLLTLALLARRRSSLVTDNSDEVSVLVLSCLVQLLVSTLHNLPTRGALLVEHCWSSVLQSYSHGHNDLTSFCLPSGSLSRVCTRGGDALSRLIAT